MKQLYSKYSLFFLLLLLGINESSAALIPVTVTTDSIGTGSVTTTSATVYGNLVSTGGADGIQAGICYGTSPNPTLVNSNYLSETGSVGSFSASLSSLTPNTIYYVVAYAIANGNDTVYGSQLQFTTDTVAFGVVSNGSIMGITATTANGNDTITSFGGDPNNYALTGMCYSTSPGPTTNNNIAGGYNAFNPGPQSLSFSNLTPNTQYYARSYITNARGTYYGAQLTFTTTAVTPPGVTTGPTNSIIATVAYDSLYITNDGGDPGVTGGVCYGTSPSPVITNTVDVVVNGYGLGASNVSLSGLKQNTVYYIRGYAINIADTSYGAQVTFTTAIAALANETTDSVNSITATTANTWGTLTNNGGDPGLTTGICYSYTTSTPTLADSSVNAYYYAGKTGVFAFYVSLQHLVPSTQYYYRTFATNAAGTSYSSSILSFYTYNDSLPVVISDSIVTANITATTANAYGTITSEGGDPAATGGFCYSKSPNPTIVGDTAARIAKSNTTGTGSFYITMKGLSPNTLYYARAYATNVAGTTYGSQLTFTTSAAVLPTVTSDSVTNITTTTADAYGTTTNNGNDPGVKSGVCYNTSPNPTTANDTVNSYFDYVYNSDHYVPPYYRLPGLTPNTTYYLRAYATNAAGTSYGSQLTFTTLPLVTISPSTPTICVGSSTTLIASGASTYTWSPSNGLSATSGATINATPATTSTYTVIGTYTGGFKDTATVTVVVASVPSLSSSLTPPAICSGSTFNYTATSTTVGATFSWSRATIAGITQAGTSGTGNVSGAALTNTTTAAINVTYAYVAAAGGCSGAGQNVIVAVNPSPKLSSSLAPPAVCSGTTISYTATSATAGSTFSWSRATIAGISPAGTTGTGNISQVLTNTTTAAKNVTFVYTTTANGCVGASQNVIISSKPKPTLSSTLTPAAFCSGNAFTYTATSATAGSTFKWTRATIAGITQTGTSGTGNVNEVLTNTTTAAINVTYGYISTAAGCSDPSQNVIVTTEPTPVLSSTLAPPAICSGTTFSYTATSATAGATFSWSRATIAGISQAGTSGTGNVSEVLTNTSTSAINITYAYTTAANGCNDASQNVVVAVNPIPVLSSTSSPAAICSGTAFNYTASSATAGSAFSWSRATIVGITQAGTTGTGNVSEALTNTTTSIINVTYAYTTAANGCNDASQNVVVAVDPTPVLSSTLSPTAICSGTAFSYTAASATAGAAFSWSRATIVGITQVGTSGTGNVGETLTNTTTSPVNVTYTYITTSNGCSDTGDNVVVAVNPTPVLSSTLSPVAICSGTTFNYSPASATAGAAFSWSRGTIAGITQVGTTGAGNVSEALTNTTTSIINVTYAYTTTANGCNDASQNVVVAVDPTPVLSSTLSPTAICSGTAFNYTAASATAGAAFSWSRATIAGITQAGTTGTGNVSEVLTNTTTSIINVTYVYTTTANGCNDASQNVVVAVDPTPVLSSTLSPAAICSGTTFTYTAASATAGSTFSWSRATIAGITQAGTSGAGNVSGALTNSTTSPINVTYVYITKANGCSDAGENMVVVVNPAPKLNSSLAPSGFCSGTAFNYTATSATAGATFSWSRATIANISQTGTSGSGNVSEVLTNTTTAAVNVTYVYITTANGCTGANQNVVVAADALPILNSALVIPTICSATKVNYTATSATAGSTFKWSRPAVTGITQAAASGTGNLNQVLTNTTTAIVNVAFTYTAIANGCSGAGQNIVVAVNPTSHITTTATACANYTSPSGKYIWTKNGTYKDTLSNYLGCDSIITTVLTLKNVSFPLNILTQDQTGPNACNGYLEAASKAIPPYTYTWSDSVTVNSPYRYYACAGTYSVTVVDSLGCSALAVATIGTDAVKTSTGTSPLSIIVHSQDATSVNLCNGAANIQVKGGKAPYSLRFAGKTTTTSNYTINNLCSGFYTVNVTDVNSDTAWYTFVIGSPLTTYNSIPPKFIADSTFQDSLATTAINNCTIFNINVDSIAIQSFALVGTDSIDVIWGVYQNNFGSITPLSQTYKYSSPGLYKVEVDIYCTSRSSSSVRGIGDVEIIPRSTGIETIGQPAITVYPNPFSSTFTISGINGNADIQVFNLLGATVYSEKGVSGKTEVNLQGNVPGVYTIQVINNNGVVNLTVIKE